MFEEAKFMLEMCKLNPGFFNLENPETDVLWLIYEHAPSEVEDPREFVEEVVKHNPGIVNDEDLEKLPWIIYPET